MMLPPSWRASRPCCVTQDPRRGVGRGAFGYAARMRDISRRAVGAADVATDEAAFDRFEVAAGRFADVHDSVARYDGAPLVRSDWCERNERLADQLRPRPARDFLKLDDIRYQMFVDQRHLAA